MATIYSTKTTPHTRRTPKQVVPPCSYFDVGVLTKHTRQLLKYIERQPIQPFRLSKTSKDCLSGLLKQIHHSSVHTPSYKLDNIPPSEMTQVMSEFEKTNESKLIPPSIWSNISSSEKLGRIVSAQLHGRTIHLFLILPKSTTANSRMFSSQKLAESFFHKCARRIIVWLDIALQFSGKECASTLDCYLFFTDDLKKLPKKPTEHIHLNDGGGRHGHDLSSKVITPKHANTAFTYSCIPSAKIVLFRMEEWFKVFIHESFHCFGLDFSQMNVAESNKHMLQLFPKCQTGMDFRIYETYCETWAETIHILFIAYSMEPYLENFNNAYNGVSARHTRRCSMKCRKAFSISGKCSCCPPNRGGNVRTYRQLRQVRSEALAKRKTKGLEDLPAKQACLDGVPRRHPDYPEMVTHRRIMHILKRIEYMIQRERMFSLFQMSKVLAHHSLQYADVCSTLDNGKKYTEETQVFAYYIVKSILLFHLNDFIEWCNKHNGDNTMLFFKKTESNIREYGNLIERLYMLPAFVKIVETEQTKYSRLTEEDLSSKDNILDTLRMSLFEMQTT